MEVTVLGIVTLVSAVQFLKAEVGMEVPPLITTDCNSLTGKDVIRCAGSVADLRFVQPLNAVVFSAETLLGMVIAESAVQFVKAFSSMVVIEVGRLIFVIVVPPEKAPAPMVCTDAPL